jgi:hypothetical protein
MKNSAALTIAIVFITTGANYELGSNHFKKLNIVRSADDS